MSSGERPIGAAKGKQSDTEALCHPPPPPPRVHQAQVRRPPPRQRAELCQPSDGFPMHPNATLAFPVQLNDTILVRARVRARARARVGVGFGLG